MRSRLVGQRTAVINQIRSFLLERGIAVRQGPRFLRQRLPEILAKRIDVLSPRMIAIIEDLSGDWRRLDERVERVTEEVRWLRPLPTALPLPRDATLPPGSASCRSRCRPVISDIEKLKYMASFGHDGRSIARALGRSAQSVRVKAVELGVSLRKPSPIMDASNCHQRLGAACSSPRPIAAHGQDGRGVW